MFGLTEWISSHLVPQAAVRAEAWKLGGRHLGDVAAGAHLELNRADLTPARRALLRAVLRNAAHSSETGR